MATIRDHAGNEAQATAEFRVDVQPPTIALAEPMMGAYLRPPVTIRIPYGDESALDPGSLRILVNAADLTAPFSRGPTEAVAALDLSSGLVEGPNQIEARIRDRAGNESAAAVAFNVDVTPPILVIAQPLTGSRHGSADVEVVVQYQDDQALDLDTFVAEVDASAVSLTPVPGGATGWIDPLVDGPHRLVVRIHDAAGNQGTAESRFVVDTTLPTIQVVQPIPGSFVSDPTPSLLVTYSDADGVDTDTLRVLVDGVDRTALFTVEPDVAYADLPPEASLADGDHAVTAEVQDLTGNTGSAVSAFVVDTRPPTVTLDAPPPLTNRLPPTVTVSWTDTGSDVDPDSVQILVDGTDRTALFAIEASGATAVLDLDPPLTDGSHDVTVRVSDRAENPTEDVFSFTLDTVPPALALAPAPTPSSTIRPRSCAWPGPTPEAAAATRLRSASSCVPATTPRSRSPTASRSTGDEATWEIPDAAALADGTWRLRASLSDQAGNPATSEAAFVVDTVAPTFTVETPAHTAVLGTATPAFDILYDDDASGIDPTRLALLVDGVDRTDRLTWEPTRATGGLRPEDALVDGEHGLEVQVFDRAGNAAVMPPHTFRVDTVPPSARVESPADGSYVGSATPFVRVVFQDEGAEPSGHRDVVLRGGGRRGRPDGRGHGRRRPRRGHPPDRTRRRPPHRRGASGGPGRPPGHRRRVVLRRHPAPGPQRALPGGRRMGGRARSRRPPRDTGRIQDLDPRTRCAAAWVRARSTPLSTRASSPAASPSPRAPRPWSSSPPTAAATPRP